MKTHGGRVLVVADSQAMARGAGWGAISFEQTYPFLLQEWLRERLGDDAPLVEERGLRARTVVDVLRGWDAEVAYHKPDVIILQVGSSDCMPRVLMQRERDFLMRHAEKPIARRLLELETRYRRRILESIPGRVNVGLSRFRSGIGQVVRKARECGVRRVIIINIIPVAQVLEYFNPGTRRNVERYNRVFRELTCDPIVTLVDLHRHMLDWGGPEKMTLDGMHMKPEGNARLAAELGRAVLEAWNLEETEHADRQRVRQSGRAGDRAENHLDLG